MSRYDDGDIHRLSNARCFFAQRHQDERLDLSPFEFESATRAIVAPAAGAFVRNLLETTMATGTVKWFNSQKGYGFIQPQGGGGKDVFVHISAVERAGLSGLNEGQIVEYQEVANKGKTSAENLRVK